jgi:MutL protein
VTQPLLDAELALLVDAGSAWAKAAVIGRVRGRWRLVTHAAQPTAWGASELRATLTARLRGAADPRLAARIDDLFAGANRIECHTAKRPGRLAVVAVSREVSGSAARRAAEAAGWDVVELVTLDDGRSLSDRLAILQTVQVDAWLVAGGFDDGRSPRGMDAAALVASARRPGAGAVVWAGSVALADEVRALFEPDAATAVANPRPDHRREELAPLRTHLQELLRHVAAAERETNLSTVAMPRAIGALARTSGLRVLGVDVGARTAIRATGDLDGSVVSRVHARGGVAGAIGAPGGAGRVARLAGDAGDEAAVADILQTIRARPASVPQLPEELSATQAAARMQLAALLDDDPAEAVDLVIGAGRTIAAAPRPAQAMRILLDGLRPLGVTQLAMDVASVLGPLGSLDDDEIGEGISLLSDDLVAPLGTAVVTRGGEAGRMAMRVTVHRPGWPAFAPIEVRVGQLHLVPLARGQRAELTIELGSGVSIGAPRRSPRIHAGATGGSVGLVLDARGVPMGLPKRGDDRRAVLAGWRDALQRELGPLGERVA